MRPGTSFLGDEPDDRADAMTAARSADVVVVAVGEASDLSGEASSRADIRLPGHQEQLIAELSATGTPVVVVVVAGRPLVTAAWVDKVSAVLMAWHLGTRGPEAIAALLTGGASPAGRLAMSFPRSVGQLPLHYDHENTGRPAHSRAWMEPRTFDFGLDGPANIAEHFTSKYRDLELGPQFDFGHGLSYASFRHDGAQLTTDSIPLADLAAGSRVTLRTTVTNESAIDADEVVMVFVRDVVASLAQPVRRLAAFQRVAVAARAEVEVELSFGWDELAFWGDGGFRVEPGRFDVLVGPRPDELVRLALTITEV